MERIASLVPGATETLFAIGLGDRVEAVSHACDFPGEATELPAATRVRIDVGGDSRAIDEAVGEAGEAGEPMYEVLGEVLHHARPELVVAQEACEVCGVTPVDVEAALARVEPADRPEVLALHPHTLEDVVEDVRRLGEAAGAPEPARALARELRERVDRVARLAADRDERPRVAALDWLDPPMAAGHWVPDLVEAAGGEPLLVDPGEASRRVDWDSVVAAEPDLLALVPCGFDAERALAEADRLREREGWAQLPAACADRVVALDAGAYVSRPGPRLADGVEQLACAVVGQPAREAYPDQAERLRRVPPS